MQTATNPQTGETVVLVGDGWQKAERIASNDKGEKAYLVSGKWLTGDGATADLPQPAKPVQRGIGTELLRQGGLTLRAGAEGLTALPNMVGDAFGLKSSEATKNLLTRIGLPLPESATERVVGDVTGALAGMGGLAKVGAKVPMLAENLGTQAAATAAASGAAGTTREMGGGEGSQLIAGLAAGVAAPYAAQRVTQAVPNLIARSVQKSEATPFAKEGARLANETGIDLTLGQRSGNKMALTMENTARQYAPLADRVQDIDVKIANQAMDRVNKIADTISKNKTGPSELGTSIESTVKNAATQLDNVRDAHAARDFGRVREIAGDAKVIKLQNFTDELGKMIEEYKGVAGADAQKVTAQAQAALARITGTVQQATPAGAIQGAGGKPLTPGTSQVVGTLDNDINEAMRSRRFYGKAARGGANVFEDIAPDMNRTLAARLFGAINRDFDGAAVNATGDLRKALDVANGNYKKVSQSIEFLEKSTLGKLVGDDVVDAAVSGARGTTTAGEAVINKIMATHPSSRATAMDILERWNPQLAKDTRAFVLRDALDKGMSIAPSAKGAGQVPISFSKFVSALQGEKVGFDKQLQSYGFKPGEIKDIRDTVQAMMRAGDRTGYNASGTNVQGQAAEIASGLGAAATGNVKGAAKHALSIAGKYIGLSKFADAMASEEGRRALRTLASPRVSPQAAIAAFETIGVDAPEPRESGGPVTAGRPYLVGERGPEVVVPQQSGTVLPNRATYYNPRGAPQVMSNEAVEYLKRLELAAAAGTHLRPSNLQQVIASLGRR